jgi:hypothetical protein
MAPEPAPALDVRRRRRWLALAVLVVLVALAAYALRRNAGSAANAEDCETKPPPNAFAVAECDDGAAPGTPAAPAPAAKP